MIARDLTLSSLYDARDKLGDLIVQWHPDPAVPGQTDQLNQLLLERDKINGAINAVIDAEFKSAISSPELTAAAQQLGASAKQLVQFAQTIAQVNDVIRIADQVVQGAAKVISLAASAA